MSNLPFKPALLALVFSLAMPVMASLDVDNDDKVAPLTDGLLILRHLFGFSEASLVNGAIGDGARRDSAEDVATYLKLQESSLLDADADGEALPLTDGLLILRHLFGFSGTSLTSGAVATGARRSDAEAIKNHLIGSGAGQVTNLIGPALAQDSSSLAVIESAFNAGVVALSDHVDSDPKPTFYGVAPKVEGNVLKLDLFPESIDLSNVKAIFNGVADGGESARFLFLLDRIPEAGVTGSLTVSIGLIDGLDASTDSGERVFETSFELNWSSDGTTVNFSAPVQDQTISIKYVGTVSTTAKYTLNSVQPTILKARTPSEFPGYPLALEIRLLELFDDSLIERLRAAGLYDIVANYFDDVSNYYLNVVLEGVDSRGRRFLSYDGRGFDTIEGLISVVDVQAGSADSFNLVGSAANLTSGNPDYVFWLEATPEDGPVLSLGLFANLCRERLCFKLPPTGFVAREFLLGQVIQSDSQADLSIVANFGAMPTFAETLEYRISWTQGSDGIRDQGEQSIVMSFPIDYLPSQSVVLQLGSGDASIHKLDDGDCNVERNCSSALTVYQEPIGVSGEKDSELRLNLLPKSSDASLFFNQFFSVEKVHVTVELLGRSDVLTYQNRVISAVEGVLNIR